MENCEGLTFCFGNKAAIPPFDQVFSDSFDKTLDVLALELFETSLFLLELKNDS